MWNDLSDKIGASPNLNNMGRIDIEGATGMQLLTSLNVFSNWMLSQSKTVLDGQNYLRWSPEVVSKNIGMVLGM